MLEVSHVSKKYRGCQQALEDVSLSVGPGEIVGIFGPNGAGKTTLLKCILGLLRYGFGSVTLDGQPITPKTLPASPSPPVSTPSSPASPPPGTGTSAPNTSPPSGPAASRR